jgi:hypothetical protein
MQAKDAQRERRRMQPAPPVASWPDLIELREQSV